MRITERGTGQVEYIELLWLENSLARLQYDLYLGV
jgi:hypothetical protein